MKKYLPLGIFILIVLAIPGVVAATPTLAIGGKLTRECTVTVDQGTLGNWLFAMGYNQNPSASVTATCTGAINSWWADAKDSKSGGGTLAHTGHMTESADGTTGPYLYEPLWLAKNPPGNAPVGECPFNCMPGCDPTWFATGFPTWYNMEVGYPTIMSGTVAGVVTQGISVCQFIDPRDPIADYKFDIIFTWGVA